VSGSGKTTLIREILLPLLEARLNSEDPTAALEEEVDSESIGEAQAALQTAELEGADHLGAVVLVDQSLLGRTPRSNPAVYIGAFDDIRDFYAASPEALANELPAGCFSFNSKRGQCETCRGAGFEKIEMQFLSDVLIRCAACGGRRYQARVAAVKVAPPEGLGLSALSISDFLDATVEEAVRFLAAFPESKPARRALMKLSLLTEVGLGYLRLGQPLNTLSGGESQRLKLVSHLAATPAAASTAPAAPLASPVSRRRAESGPAGGSGAMSGFRPTLFLFDEPTTGLHLEDVRILLMVFQRLVDQGHSVVLIEHHMELLRCVDWLIDLGPESGDQGGQIVAAGPPDHVARVPESRTAPFLRD
jgi:excinuclease ABC subunit A